MKISPQARERVETLAIAAANERVPREDACPYPFNSDEGMHFTAVYLVALPLYVPVPRRTPLPAVALLDPSNKKKAQVRTFAPGELVVVTA